MTHIAQDIAGALAALTGVSAGHTRDLQSSEKSLNFFALLRQEILADSTLEATSEALVEASGPPLAILPAAPIAVQTAVPQVHAQPLLPTNPHAFEAHGPAINDRPLPAGGKVLPPPTNGVLSEPGVALRARAPLEAPISLTPLPPPHPEPRLTMPEIAPPAAPVIRRQEAPAELRPARPVPTQPLNRVNVAPVEEHAAPGKPRPPAELPLPPLPTPVANPGHDRAVPERRPQAPPAALLLSSVTQSTVSESAPRVAEATLLPSTGIAMAAHPTEAAPAPRLPLMHVPGPVGHPQWNQALGERVAVMAEQGLGRAELRLHPQHLGPLEVRVSVNNDDVSVLFQSHHPATREALEAALPRLRELMSEQGLNLTQAQVSHHSADQRGRGQAESPYTDASAHASTDEHETAHTAPAQRSPDRLIDDYA